MEVATENESAASREQVEGGSSVSMSTGERRRYRKNWTVVQAFCTLLGLSYYVSLPSMHQFVTNSAHPGNDGVRG